MLQLTFKNIYTNMPSFIRLFNIAAALAISSLLVFYVVPAGARDTDLPVLSYKDKEYLISVAYMAVEESLKKVPPEHSWPEKFDGVDNRVYVILRSKGKKLGSWYTRENNLAQMVYNATVKAINKNRLSNLHDTQIHVQIMGNYKQLDKGFERGIHGLRFENKKKGVNYYSTYALEGNYRTEKLMQRLCKKARLNDGCLNDDSVKKLYFNTLHFATTRFTNEIVTFYRGNPLNQKPTVTRSNLNHCLELAKAWLLQNLKPDGRFVYLYNPSNGTYSEKNNMIRQLMASRVLAQMSQNDSSLRARHQKNLNYIFSNWYQEKEGKGFIEFKNKSKLGANAMALRTLVHSPFYEQYSGIATSLVKTILTLQNQDGSLKPWFIAPDYHYDTDYLLTFYSGEAILSLVEYYLKTKDAAVLSAAIKSQTYYLSKYVTNLKDNYYPAYVPWHTQSLNKLYKITGDKRFVDAIFIMNDELLMIQNHTGQPHRDFLGRFYSSEHPEYGKPHSSSDSVYTEGLAYAYEIAKLVGDRQHAQKYKNAIMLGIHNLSNLQFQGSNMYYLEYPERVKGAIRCNVSDNRIRIDTTQHTIDAFMKTLELFGDDEFSF